MKEQKDIVVPDNWGGLFEQPNPEEHDLGLSVVDVFGSDQIGDEYGLDSNVPVALFDAVQKVAIEPVESLPAEYPHQIQEPVEDTDLTALEEGLSKREAEMRALTRPPCLRVSSVAPTSDAASVHLDRLSFLPDVLLRNIVSRLPIKAAARMAVLSHRWRPL